MCSILNEQNIKIRKNVSKSLEIKNNKNDLINFTHIKTNCLRQNFNVNNSQIITGF